MRLFIGAVAMSFVRLSCLAECWGPWGQRSDEWHAYAVHDDYFPSPRKITVAPSTCVPSDAIVLWNGDVSCLTNWCDSVGNPTKWIRAEDGDFVSVKDAGNVQTRESFEDIQLHVEFATEVDLERIRRGSGNSGVFLPGGYEIQIIDSLQEPERTRGLVEGNYADGSCGALYGQKPPDVNPARGQSEWQSFDIVFHPARSVGASVRKATLTLFFNGVLVQDHWMCEAPTTWQRRDTPALATKGPLVLQYHGTPVHYRNIWVRRILPRESINLYGEFADKQAVAAKRRELADQAEADYEKWEGEMPLPERLARAWGIAAYSPTEKRVARAHAVEEEFVKANGGKPLSPRYIYESLYLSLRKVGLIDDANPVLRLLNASAGDE